MSSNNTKKLRRLLRENGPKCHYCGCTTVPPTPGKASQAHNSATVEHIYPKIDLRRYAEGGNIVVIACRRCNSNRGTTEADKMTRNYLQQLAKDGPVIKTLNICQ